MLDPGLEALPAIAAAAVDGTSLGTVAAAVEQQDEGQRPCGHWRPTARRGHRLEAAAPTGLVTERGDADRREDGLGTTGAAGWLAGASRSYAGGGRLLGKCRGRGGQEHGEGEEREREAVRSHGGPSCGRAAVVLRATV